MGMGSLIYSVWRGTSDGVPSQQPPSLTSSPEPSPCTVVSESRISSDSSIASLDSHQTVSESPPSACTVSAPCQSSVSTPPRPSPRHRVTFTLSQRLYRWLEAMAVLHNYGSVHRSVRDLLDWARTGDDTDMEWLFGFPHELPAIPCIPAEDYHADTAPTRDQQQHHPQQFPQQPLPAPSEQTSPALPCPKQQRPPSEQRPQHDQLRTSNVDSVTNADTIATDASCIARRCKASAARTTPFGPVALDTFLVESMFHWVTSSVRRFSLSNPSDVLEAVIRSVIELGAADDVFDCSHELPSSTAELYHDLGILGYTPLSSVSSSVAASTSLSPR